MDLDALEKALADLVRGPYEIERGYEIYAPGVRFAEMCGPQDATALVTILNALPALIAMARAGAALAQALRDAGGCDHGYIDGLDALSAYDAATKGGG